jgi:hypothetical protein
MTEPKHEKQPMITHMVVVGGEMTVLDTEGKMFQRSRNRKYMGGPAADQPEFVWTPVRGPHG